MSFGESHHSKSHPAHPGTHILWPNIITTPLQSTHCISNTLALICLQWDPTHSAQSQSLYPEIGLFPIVLCTRTQTFLPKFGKNCTIPNSTVTQTQTLRLVCIWWRANQHIRKVDFRLKSLLINIKVVQTLLPTNWRITCNICNKTAGQAT